MTTKNRIEEKAGKFHVWDASGNWLAECDTREAAEAFGRHFFATHALGFSCSDVSREDAIEKLLMDRRLTDPKWVNNCLKSGEPLTVFTCQVNCPVDAPYRIEWYQPVGVETQDGQNFFVLHLSAKAHAVMRDPGDRVRELEAQAA